MKGFSVFKFIVMVTVHTSIHDDNLDERGIDDEAYKYEDFRNA